MISALWHILPGYDMSASPAERIGATTRYITTSNGIAIIPIIGPTSKFGEYGGASTVAVRGHLRHAVSNQAVRAIMLLIDSPGGTVAGSMDLANDVHTASMAKPLFAYAQDTMASAQLQVGSQAGQIFANEAAQIGSIGTLSRLIDMSALAESMGIKVHAVSSGGMKSMGVPGTPITQEHLDYMQGLVNQMTQAFINAVAFGRRMEPAAVSQLADGRVHFAADAAKLGLIDGVMSFDQALESLSDFSQRLKA